MLETREEKCHAIIHGAAAATAATGAGLAQLPFADTIPITAIQVGMITSLGHVFDVDLSESTAKALLGGFASATLGRNVAGALVGLIPIVGNALKAGTAGALTEAIGWAAVSHFENLEQEKEKAFMNGVNSAEIKFKEKIKEILKKIKEEDNFKLVLILISYYITENYNNDIKLLSVCFENKNKNERIEETINMIDRTDMNVLLKSIKEYLVKMPIEDIEGLKKIIMEFNKIDRGVKKEKEEEILKMIDIILKLYKSDLLSEDEKKREEQILKNLEIYLQ